jgi:serine/threonine protein phosphatase PrpC
MSVIPVYIINDANDKLVRSKQFFDHPRFQVEVLDNKFGDEWIKRIISIASMRVDNNPIIITGTDKLLMNKSQKELLDIIDSTSDNPDFWDIINLGVANDNCDLYHNCITIDGNNFCRSQGMPLVLLVSSKAVDKLAKSFRESTAVPQMKVITVYPNIFDFDVTRAKHDELMMANKCLISSEKQSKDQVYRTTDSVTNSDNNWFIVLLILIVFIFLIYYLYNRNKFIKL